MPGEGTNLTRARIMQSDTLSIVYQIVYSNTRHYGGSRHDPGTRVKGGNDGVEQLKRIPGDLAAMRAIQIAGYRLLNKIAENSPLVSGHRFSDATSPLN